MLSNEYLEILERQDEVFGGQVKKWFPKLKSMCRDYAEILGKDSEDIMQDLLLSMFENIQYYNKPFVRYEGHLWEVVQRAEGSVEILRRSYRKGHYGEEMARETVLVSKIEEVKKAALGTFLYRGLWNSLLRAIKSRLTQKNGFEVTAHEEKVVIERLKKRAVTKKVPVYTQVSGEVPMPEDEEGRTPQDFAPWIGATAEETLELQSILNFIRARVSEPAKRLLVFMLSEDDEYLSEVSEEYQQCGGTPSRDLAVRMGYSPESIAGYVGVPKSFLPNLYQEIEGAFPA